MIINKNIKKIKFNLLIDIDRKKIKIKDLKKISVGDIVKFNKNIKENLDIYISNKQIAKCDINIINEKKYLKIYPLKGNNE